MGLSSKRETKYFFMFISIGLIGFLLFYVYPIGRTLYLSTTNMQIGTSNIEFVGLQNYITALTKDDIFFHSIKQSLIFAFISGPLTLMIALFVALLLNSAIKGVGIYRTIFFLPFVIPTFAVAAVFKGLFHPTSGIINKVLSYFSIDGPGWYMQSDTAMVTLIIISCWGFGVRMLIFLAALQNVPMSLYEVATLEGASRWKKLIYITLPTISPVFFFNVVLTTIDSLKSFNLAFFMGNGEGFPANVTLLFPIYLFNTAFKIPFKLGYASSIAWIFFVLIMILTGVNFLLSKLYVNENVE